MAKHATEAADEMASAKRLCLSADSDMSILAKALHFYGLISSAKDMDASMVSSNRKEAVSWTVGCSVAVEQLPEAHRVIYSNVSKATVVIGLSTEEVQALLNMPEELRPLSQDGAHFYERVITSTDSTSAATRLKDMDNVIVLMLRDSGKAFVIGDSIANAFTNAYNLQKTVRTQLLVGTHDAIIAPAEVWTRAIEQNEFPDFKPGVEWPAVKRGVQRSFIAEPLGELAVGDASEEQKARFELAKCHRKLCKHGFDELIWNHCSTTVGEKILITPGDCLWDEVTPDNLLLDSKNVTANILHSAIYAAVPSAKAVVHTHAPGLEAVSCISDGLVVPKGSLFAGRVAYHAWQGLSDDSQECTVIGEAIKKISNCTALIANNHGAFTWGSSIDEALERHMLLEQACRDQLKSANRGATRWMKFDEISPVMGA